MNFIDEFLARIPISELTIKTTISSYAVIERIEYAVKPNLIKRRGAHFFTFDGSYKGNYFKIQGHLRNPDGEDAFPNNASVGIGFIRFPLRIETSPTFYGRVFDGVEGSIIRGHFGLPFPGLAALGVLLFLLLGKIYPNWHDRSMFFSICLTVWSVLSLMEFITERKGILDFLKGLFFNVIKTE